MVFTNKHNITTLFGDQFFCSLLRDCEAYLEENNAFMLAENLHVIEVRQIGKVELL
jgi:hypothetical protein